MRQYEKEIGRGWARACRRECLSVAGMGKLDLFFHGVQKRGMGAMCAGVGGIWGWGVGNGASLYFYIWRERKMEIICG